MRESRGDAVLHELRRRILALELVPGERISERSLEAAVGASRTPVRAALFRLEREGLVRREERAWRVSPLDVAEIEDLGVFRETVETAAVRLAATRPTTPARTAALDAVAADLDAAAGGDRFHLGLAAVGGNRFLVEALETALARLSRVRALELQTPGSLATSLAEHRAILAAVRAGDAERAAALVVEHAAGVRARVVESLAVERTRGLRVDRGDR